MVLKLLSLLLWFLIWASIGQLILCSCGLAKLLSVLFILLSVYFCIRVAQIVKESIKKTRR